MINDLKIALDAAQDDLYDAWAKEDECLASWAGIRERVLKEIYFNADRMDEENLQAYLSELLCRRDEAYKGTHLCGSSYQVQCYREEGDAYNDAYSLLTQG